MRIRNGAIKHSHSVWFTYHRFLECLEIEQQCIEEQPDFIDQMRITNVVEQICQDPSTVIYVASNWEPILFRTIVISPGSIMGSRTTNVISTINLKD